MYTLSNDCYNMMFLMSARSTPFWYASMVLSFKIIILIIIPYSLCQQDPAPPGYNDENNNSFNVPLEVGPIVIASQLTAILLTILFTSSALTDMFSLLTVGYTAELGAMFPGASAFKFWFTLILRFLTGMASIGDNFLFIVQSDRALDVFLNFAAILFIQELDGVGYESAHHGFFGSTLRKAAMLMQDVQVIQPHDEDIVDMIRPAMLASVSLISFGMYSWLLVRQLQGAILFNNVCTHVE